MNMAEGTKVTRVFAKTYSKENRIYRSWRRDSVRPVPLISSHKGLRPVEEHVPVPSNSPVSSDSSNSTESNSSPYSDSTHFRSLSQHQSSNTRDDSDREVTLKSPNAPYRNNKKVQYSIIIEESDDADKPEAPVRKGSLGFSAKKLVRNFPKSSSAPVRNLQKTKMMKDSLQSPTASDSVGLSFFDLDSSSISLIDEDDRNSSEYVSSNQEDSTILNQQYSTQEPHTCLSEENLELSDIEVMRDAPAVGATTKKQGEKKDLTSFLKISAVKIFPQQGGKSKQRILKTKEGRKNSTLNEIESAKNIQEISFCEDDISHIPAHSAVSSECTSGDDSSSTLKGTPQKMPLLTKTLKEIHSNVQRDSPTTLTKNGVKKGNLIRTPKKHNIRKVSVCSVPSPLGSEIGKQVSFQKAANEESFYEPGSAVKKDPVPVQLPQLSPSLSILKKAVSTWKLESQEENTENLPCKVTSTPLSKRKSKSCRPSKMAFSFDVSAVPLPSYDNDDLMAPLPQSQTADINKVSSINKEKTQSPYPNVNRHETPRKQVKRDSPEPTIPSRPSKRRCSRVHASSSTDTEQESPNKIAIRKSSQQGQKKRLEYRDKGVGPPKCVVTILPDVHFQQARKTSTKFTPRPCLNLSFLKNVAEDIIPTLPDSVFS